MSQFLYTITNRRTANAVVAMEILEGGASVRQRLAVPNAVAKDRFRRKARMRLWIDGKLLYAVDFGSGSFAIFRRNPDGTLARLNDTPVSSQGNSPCSLCASGAILYVLNQGVRSSGAKAQPSLAVFAIEGDNVRYLPDSSFNLRQGESPTQVIVNPQGTLLAVPSVRNRSSLVHFYKINPGTAGPGC